MDKSTSKDLARQILSFNRSKLHHSFDALLDTFEKPDEVPLETITILAEQSIFTAAEIQELINTYYEHYHIPKPSD